MSVEYFGILGPKSPTFWINVSGIKDSEIRKNYLRAEVKKSVKIITPVSVETKIPTTSVIKKKA